MNVGKKSKLGAADYIVGSVAEFLKLFPYATDKLENDKAETCSTLEQINPAACSQSVIPTCPCCGTKFVCTPTTPFTCDCRNVQLTPEDRTALHACFGARCLCNTCLLSIHSKP